MSTENTEIADVLERRKQVLAELVVVRCWAETPELAKRYDDRARLKCIEDVSYHLSYLSNAIGVSCPELFCDYVKWAQVLLDGIGIPESVVITSLRAIMAVFETELPAIMAQVAAEYIEYALASMGDVAVRSACAPIVTGVLSALAQQYVDLLLEGDRHGASRLILDAVESGTSIEEIYLDVFQPSQIAIGRLWQTGRVSVAHEHLCSATTQLVMSQLYSRIFTTRRNGRTMIAASVSGDLHEIGCRMVADFFEMDGWDTIYFGASTPTPSIVQAIGEYRPELIAISATMTFHLRAVRELIDAVRKADPEHKINVIVGGYCFNVVPDLWHRVGADLHAQNAQEAVARVRRVHA